MVGIAVSFPHNFDFFSKNELSITKKYLFYLNHKYNIFIACLICSANNHDKELLKSAENGTVVKINKINVTSYYKFLIALGQSHISPQRGL